MSAVSLVFATAVAGRPGQQLDLWLVRDWLEHWRRHGNPYLVFDNLDYPPGALLVLWPLSLVSDNIAAVILPPLMVVATAAAALILVRWFSSRLAASLRWQEQAALVAMVMAGSSIRGAIWRGQTAPLSFLFGALALHWSARRPGLAAMALALCAFKPHVALGFALAILLTKRRDVVIYAGALTLALTAAFAATIDYPVTDLLGRYAQILAMLYDGPAALPGLLSVRWIIDGLFGDRAATLVYVTTAVFSLGFIISVARRARDPVTRVQITAACLLWSLVFLPHQLYNGILAIPAIWLLMWPESMLLSSERARVAVVTSLILFRVVDVPRLVRFAAVYGGNEWLEAASYWLRPMILAALLAFVLRALARRAEGADTQTV